jgi:hypothetical protein
MGKYLDFYNKCAEDQHCPFLCHQFTSEMYGLEDDPLFTLFKPTAEELYDHVKDGYGRVAWGCMGHGISYEFTDLRQNIVLFMAAMNNEL